jgi:preprotein translocase subunit SecA
MTIEKIIKSIFGDPSEKKVKEITKLIGKIKEFENAQEKFSLENIKDKTSEFKAKFEGLDFEKEEDSKKILSILDEIKLEAFALVKTACKLINNKEFTLNDGKIITWNMIPYDVQLV